MSDPRIPINDLAQRGRIFAEAVFAEDSISYNMSLDREQFRRILIRRANAKADSAEGQTTLLLTPAEREFLAKAEKPSCAEFAPKNLERR